MGMPHEIPKNKVRKAFTLLYCLRRLQHLQNHFDKAYKDDAFVNDLAKLLEDEYNRLMVELEQLPDYKELVQAHWSDPVQ